MNEHKTDQAELEKIDIFRILQEYGKALSRLWWLVIVLAVACGGALVRLRGDVYHPHGQLVPDRYRRQHQLL